MSTECTWESTPLSETCMCAMPRARPDAPAFLHLGAVHLLAQRCVACGHKAHQEIVPSVRTDRLLTRGCRSKRQEPPKTHRSADWHGCLGAQEHHGGVASRRDEAILRPFAVRCDRSGLTQLSRSVHALTMQSCLRCRSLRTHVGSGILHSPFH